MQTNTIERPTTHEGAPAIKITAYEQLRRSVLSCLLWEKEFYENGETIAQRIHTFAAQCEAQQVALLAIEARNVYHLRHVPLWLIVSLLGRAGQLRGFTLAEVILKVVKRPDEMGELISLYWLDGKKPLPRQLKKGLALAFVTFDEYQLAKWNRRRAVNIVDVMALVHPKPIDEAQAALFKRVANCALATPNTWESHTAAGQDMNSVFTNLLKSNALGYMALLRNLRNLVKHKVDRTLVKIALGRPPTGNILPFRFIAAAKAAPEFEHEIDHAMQLSLMNQPRMKGKTALLIDVSYSMDDKLSRRSEMTRRDAAAGLAVIVANLSDDIEIFTFSNHCVQIAPRRTLRLAEDIANSQRHGGTALGASVQAVNTHTLSDRLIVITDEQSHDRVGIPCGLAYMINVASNRNGVGYDGLWNHIDGFSEASIHFIQELEQEGEGSSATRSTFQHTGDS